MLSGSHFGLRNIYSQGHIFNHLWIVPAFVCLFVCLSVFSASVPMRLVLKQSVLRNNRSAGARLRVNRCQRLLGPNHTLFNCSTLLGKRATLASASIYSAYKTCPALPTTAPSTGHHSHSARCLHLPNSAVLLLLNSILKSFHFPEKYKWSRWQVD